MKKFIKELAIGALIAGVFIVLHEVGTAERGYEAIGGEIAVALFILFIVWVITGGKAANSEVDIDDLD